MSRRLLGLALALSLLFNAGFLVGWMRPPSRAMPFSGSGREHPLRDVRLSPDQRRRLIDAAADAAGPGAEVELRAREALRAALVAEPVDERALRAAGTAWADIHEARARRGRRGFVETLALLDADQRRQAAERLANEEYRGGRWKPLRARFDADRDGRLDPAERAAAAKALRDGR
ncbi:MAG TPA: periplasmic heavy metal sensor [Planctomycetota bacterium]|nr:periplasmic heavy metal sensor [Planctomycetota bacterium]